MVHVAPPPPPPGEALARTVPTAPDVCDAAAQTDAPPADPAADPAAASHPDAATQTATAAKADAATQPEAATAATEPSTGSHPDAATEPAAAANANDTADDAAATAGDPPWGPSIHSCPRQRWKGWVQPVDRGAGTPAPTCLQGQGRYLTASAGLLSDGHPSAEAIAKQQVFLRFFFLLFPPLSNETFCYVYPGSHDLAQAPDPPVSLSTRFSAGRIF